METKVVVPEAMKRAAIVDCCAREDTALVILGLERALRWWAENPIVPTDEQAKVLGKVYATNTSDDDYHGSLKRTVVEWQRRMFAPPEPEVPEAVKDLLWAGRKVNPLVSDSPDALQMQHDLWILEAYRRGQRSR